MSACHAMPLDAGLVRDILASVDCNVQVYSAAGYLALTGPGSPFPAALTTLLTLYVVLLGYRLLFGVGVPRLAETPLIALKIGVILALTLNWSVFQTLVFNVDANAPLQIGRLISQPMRGAAGGLAADPVNGVQAAYDELRADAAELSRRSAETNAVAGATPSTPTSEAESAAAATAAGLRRAAGLLIASTAGLLGMAFIAVGVLTAVGPVFIALLLFDATRGLFVGWMRALVAAMLTPMVCWIAASLLLVVLAPRIDLLAEQRLSQHIVLDTADAASAIVLIFAAAQVALIVGGLLVASGFDPARLAPARTVVKEAAPSAGRSVEPSLYEVRSRGHTLASSLRADSSIQTTNISGRSRSIDFGGPAAQADYRMADTRSHRVGEAFRRRPATRYGQRADAARTP